MKTPSYHYTKCRTICLSKNEIVKDESMHKKLYELTSSDLKLPEWVIFDSWHIIIVDKDKIFVLKGRTIVPGYYHLTPVDTGEISNE